MSLNVEYHNPVFTVELVSEKSRPHLYFRQTVETETTQFYVRGRIVVCLRNHEYRIVAVDGLKDGSITHISPDPPIPIIFRVFATSPDSHYTCMDPDKL